MIYQNSAWRKETGFKLDPTGQPLEPVVKRGKMEKPELNLVGQDGNAFMVLGLAQRAAKKAGWTKEEIDKFISEATAGDYNHLLATCMEHFEVS